MYSHRSHWLQARSTQGVSQRTTQLKERRDESKSAEAALALL